VVTGDKLIQVKNLKKYYNNGSLHALDDVSVDIHKYEGDVKAGSRGKKGGKQKHRPSETLMHQHF